MAAATIGAIPDTTAPQIIWCEYPKGTVDNLHKHRFRIRWLAQDEHYISRAYFNDVTFRTILDTDPFSIFSGNSYQEFSGLSSGSHTFQVEAKDVAGNTSSRSISFNVQ